jgi:cytochrome c2
VNPKMVKVAAPLQRGAEVFVKTCSKCHRYKGFGGKKAPNMKFMMRRWRLKSDEKLKKFLRSPQDQVNRKIQMSAFNGSDEDLDALVKFLRSVK